jgi:PPE-repeat protein
VLDFGALPPEINSARMYAGAGSSSLQAAASAWNRVAAELSSTATGYDNVITQLASEEWLGPASTSMASAAQPYASWMSATAAQAELTATQARVAVAAYEQAFTATVPPPLIAANRAQTAQLVSTNVLGQNTPAIAQLEARYGQMWAQDAAAMYTYAGQSSTVAQAVTPFASPAQVANPAGTASQAAAVTASTSSATGTGAQSALSQLYTELQSALSGLTSPLSSSSLASSSTSTNPIAAIYDFIFGAGSYPPTSLSGFLGNYANYASFFYNTEGLPYFSVGMWNNAVQIAKSTGLLGGAPAAAAAGGAAKGATGGLGGLGGLLGGGGGAPAVSAGLGNSSAVGRLSVPPAWGGASAALPPSSAPMPISSVAAAPEPTGGAGNLLGGMPLAGTGVGAPGSGPRYGFRPTVMARPPFAG